MGCGEKKAVWHWEITRACNLRCKHCLYSDNHAARKELNTNDALAAIDNVKSLGGKFLKLTGGEPTARHDLREILSKASQLGLETEMVTNGTLLDKSFIGWLGSLRGFCHLAVSFDGNEAVHDYVRGKGVYRKAISTVNLAKSSGIPVSAFITINKMNWDSAPLLIRELAGYGVRSFHLNDLNLSGRAVENREILEIGASWEQLRSELVSGLEPLVFLGDILDSSDISCTAGKDSVFLASDGEIFHCSEIAMLRPEKRISNILDANAKEKLETTDFGSLNCRYEALGAPGLSICLDRGRECPLTR